MSIPALIRLELVVARQLEPEDGWRELEAVRAAVAETIGKEPARSTVLSALSREVTSGRVELQVAPGPGRTAQWRWRRT